MIGVDFANILNRIPVPPTIFVEKERIVGNEASISVALS